MVSAHFHYFISFAFSDDEEGADGAKGRVSYFRQRVLDRFGLITGKKKNRDFFEYFCKAKTDTGVINTYLEAEARRAQVLLPVVTPYYLGSEPCQNELKWFLEGRKDAGLKFEEAKAFIIPVQLECCEGRSLGVLDNIIAELFWREAEADLKMPFLGIGKAVDPSDERALAVGIERVARRLKKLAEPIWNTTSLEAAAPSRSIVGRLKTTIADTVFVDALPQDTDVARRAASALEKQGFRNINNLADEKSGRSVPIDFDNLARESETYLIVCNEAPPGLVEKRVRHARKVRVSTPYANVRGFLVDASRTDAYSATAERMKVTHVTGAGGLDAAAATIRRLSK